MPYNPQIENRVGEYIMRGGEANRQGIMALIQGLTQMGAEKTARAERLKNEADKGKAIDNLVSKGGYSEDDVNLVNSLGTAGKVEWLENKAVQSRQQKEERAAAAVSPFLAALIGNQQPVDDPQATLKQGNGPVRNMVQRPGMLPQEALSAALQSNPDVANDANVRSSILANAINGSLAQPGSARANAINGSLAQPGSALAKDSTIALEPNDTFEKTDVPGLFRVKRNGKSVGWYQASQSAPHVPGEATTKAGWHQASQSAPHVPKAGKPSFADLVLGSVGKSRQPDGGAPEIPTVTTQEDFDALESGAQYIGKDGQTYEKP